MRHRHLFFALIRVVWASNQVYVFTYDPARSLMKERETFLEDIEEEYDEPWPSGWEMRLPRALQMPISPSLSITSGTMLSILPRA